MLSMSRNYGLSVRLIAAAAALLAGTVRAQSGAEELRLTVGKSIIIDYPADIRQISTSSPDVVDASPVTVRELLVQGKGIGTATLIVWSKTGARMFYNVDVEINLEPLRRLITETLPNEDIHIQSERDSISLTGRVSTQAVADRALALATPFAKTTLNNLQVATPPVDKQIVLRVKFAQLDRLREKQFAVNFISGAGNMLSGATTGQFGTPVTSGTIGSARGSTSGSTTISDALNIFAFRPDLNLAAFIKDLQQESILEILAEPNLVTSNGKEASFLVGGEFPVPVLQGGGNAGAVTIMYREFGIRLRFTPIITGNGTIRMHLTQEVSSLDYGNAVTLSGFTIPAMASRKAETEVELGAGQSFAVAGLIDRRDTDVYSRIPGLANLPIFGQLFRSRDHAQNRSDLVMVVTPEITQPLNPGDPSPVPYFPRDFLTPITPAKTGMGATLTPSGAPAETEKSSSGRHWYSPWKSSSN